MLHLSFIQVNENFAEIEIENFLRTVNKDKWQMKQYNDTYKQYQKVQQDL